MTKPPRTRKSKSNYAGHPTTITIYLSAMEEETLSDRAKTQNQSVPAFVATLLRERLNESLRESKGGPA